MNSRIYLTIMGALATVAAAGLLTVLLAPLAKPLAWALIIGVATTPHYRKIKKSLPCCANLSAGIMVLVMTLCFVLPVTAVVVAISQNAADWLKESEKFVQAVNSTKSNFLSQTPTVNKVLILIQRVGIDITGYAARFAALASQYLIDAAANAAKNLADLLFTVVLALFILFFIYRDGDAIVSAGVTRFAANQEKTLFYLSEIQSTTTAVIVGTGFTSLIQGVLAGVGYFFAGIPLPVLLGLLTAVAGLLPVAGTALVWVPVAAVLAFGGEYMKGALLALYSFIVVIGITDSIIRPRAVGAKSSSIPTVAVVLGAVGGVMAVGALGLILGPITLAIVTMAWRDLTGTGETRFTSRNRPDSLDDSSL